MFNRQFQSKDIRVNPKLILDLVNNYKIPVKSKDNPSNQEEDQ